jgi:hypothetical protein
MYRLDFKATPEWGDSSTGTITYKDGVYTYDVNSFSLGDECITDTDKLSQNFSDISYLELKTFRESITGSTQARKDEIWRDIAEQRTSVRLWSEIEQRYVFEGRIASAETHMDSTGKIYKTVQCESELAYLADVNISLAEIYAAFDADLATDDNLFIGDGAVLIQEAVDIYNRKTGGFAGNISKRFTVQLGPHYPNGDYPYSILFYRSPYVPGSSTISNCALHKDSEIDTMTVWAFVKWVCAEHGLSVSVKYDPNHPGTDEDGHLILYVEGLASSGRQFDVKSTPTIHLRENMKSLKVVRNFSGSGRVTHIVPLGGVGANGRRLDISSHPQYNPITGEVFYSTAVPNFQLAVTYGTVERIEYHDDLVDDGNRTAAEVEMMITTLYDRGIISAQALNDKITSVQVGALDLAEAGADVDAFEVGYSYEMINEMLDYQSGGSTVAFDKTYQLLKKVTPLSAPWRASFVFGDEIQSVNKKNLSKQLALKQQIYATGGGIASRLDNAAIKLCSSESEYTNFGTHREETLYTVPQSNGETWLYKGDERIVISEGGGGGDSFTVDYASVLSSEQSVKYTTGETMSVAAQCGMTAIYGGAPSRGVCNGYRVLFNVPYADITQEDVSSYLVLPNPQGTYPSIDKAGQYTVFRCRLSEQTQTRFVLTVYWTRYNADGTAQTSDSYSYLASYSGSLSGLTFGMVADVNAIEEYDATWQAAGVYGRYRGEGHGQDGSAVTVKAWLNGAAVALSFPTSGGASDWFFIKSLAEWHFDLSLSKRYEPSGGV